MGRGSTIERLERLLKIESQFEVKFKEITRLATLNILNVSSWVRNFPLKKAQRRWLNELLINLNDPSSLRVKGYKYELYVAIAAYAVFQSDSCERLRDEDLAEIKYGAAQKFPLKTSDLLKCFMPSKELGNELNRLKDVWFASNLHYDRDDLLKELENNIR